MSRCKYNYYVTLILCNQFYRGGVQGAELLRERAPATPRTTTATFIIIWNILYSTVYFNSLNNNNTLRDRQCLEIIL